MRRDLPYFTTLAALLRLAERQAAEGVALCPQSLAALAAFTEASNAAPRKLPPGRWAAVFRGCLAALGWPGERSLSSHEFQARRAFGEVLDGFGRFDALLGPLNFSEAVRRLGQLCRQRLFQPETRGRPAIQVLGVLESAGLCFDGLWVMGMNDDQWPPPPRPNPLLPADVLRAAGASHASAEVELDFARRVHARPLDAPTGWALIVVATAATIANMWWIDPVTTNGWSLWMPGVATSLIVLTLPTLRIWHALAMAAFFTVATSAAGLTLLGTTRSEERRVDRKSVV